MPQPAADELIRFGKIVMQWSAFNNRPLPWKDFSDPYHIWIAEIILQQTRVDQGAPYFEKFIRYFPDLVTLAEASLEDVLLVWEGLGYYSRARHLHETARHVHYDLQGNFPVDSAGLQKLKGIGPYTAAAIASFAFGEEIGVVDGNVKRVVSRYFNMSGEINSSGTHRQIQALVNEVVVHFPSPKFNQAIMDFGAVMCTPGQPDCANCPASSYCRAYQLDKVNELPVKSRYQKKQERWVYFGVFVHDGCIALIQNKQSNIWKNLFLFPVIDEETGFKHAIESTDRKTTPDLPLLEKMEWILSHRKLNIYLYQLNEPPVKWEQHDEIVMVQSEDLINFALPRPLRLFLIRNSCKLGLKNMSYDQ